MEGSVIGQQEACLQTKRRLGPSPGKKDRRYGGMQVTMIYEKKTGGGRPSSKRK